MSKPIIVALSIFISLCLGITLLWPKYKQLREIGVQIEEKNLQLQYQQEYLSELKRTSSELKNYQDSLTKIDSAFPPNPSLPSTFDFLYFVASKSGLVVKSIGVSSPTRLAKIKEIPFDLSLFGSYLAFKDFLQRLEKSARFFEVKTLSFSSPPEGGPFNFRLRISTYSY